MEKPRMRGTVAFVDPADLPRPPKTTGRFTVRVARHIHGVIRSTAAERCPFTASTWKENSQPEEGTERLLITETSNIARQVAALMNAGYDAGSGKDKAGQTLTNQDPSTVNEATIDVWTLGHPVPPIFVRTELRHLAGRLLTLLDASITHPGQHKALSSLIKKEMRSSISTVFKRSQMDPRIQEGTPDGDQSDPLAE